MDGNNLAEPEVEPATGLVKYVPNALSAARIPLSLSLLLVKPFSNLFILLYFAAGLTDLFDGRIARRYRVESTLGAKLDSVADFTFFGCAFYVIVVTFSIPAYLLMWVAALVLMRGAGLVMALRKFHTWAALHTYANKTAFFAFYLFPLASWMFGVALAGTVLCAITTYAFAEETYINAHSLTLDVDIPNARALR